MILSLIIDNPFNEVRHMNGLSKLERNVKADSAALLHNLWMIKNNKYQHGSLSDESNCPNNLKKYGIEFTECSECICMVSYNRSMPVDRVLNDALNKFLKSDSHRECIISRNFSYMGLSVTEKKDGLGFHDYYVTLVLYR